MTRKNLILLATGGSLILLLGAFAFQYFGGLPPCQLCLWQRWPHAAAIVIGLTALSRPGALLPLLGAAAALTTALIGVYHAGVEQKWWEGPSSCAGSGASLGGLSGADLLNLDTAAPVVMCDEIVWDLMGLSMAGWNGVLSLMLVGLWLLAARAQA